MTSVPAVTSLAILDAAERITQAIGYNGLSFRDIAAAVGIKSASVHYHYPTKGRLGAAVARRYTDRLAAHLDAIDAQGGGPSAAMAAYLEIFRKTLEDDGRMCLCGILAAETDAIPPEVRLEVGRFVDLNVHWLTTVIGRATHTLGPASSAGQHAKALFAAIEGAMLVARGTSDIACFDTIVAQFARAGLLPQ